jgi:hypothetical protein
LKAVPERTVGPFWHDHDGLGIVVFNAVETASSLKKSCSTKLKPEAHDCDKASTAAEPSVAKSEFNSAEVALWLSDPQ